MEYTHKQKGADKMYKTWHAQSGYMFIYTYSDGGSIVSRERTYPIKKGALAVVAPGKYHYTMPKDQELYERSKLFLTRDEAKNILHRSDFSTSVTELLYMQPCPKLKFH